MIRRARLLLVLLVGLTMTGVTACGSVDAGSEAAAEFRLWMADTEHVDSLDMNSNNDLPWSGRLWAGVVVEPDATVAQIADVARRATSFESRASATFTIGYTRDDFVARFAVFPGATAANLAMIQLADHVGRSTAATEFTAVEASGRDEAGVTVTGPDDFLVVFDELRTLLAAKDVRAGNLLTVRDEAETFSIVADRTTGETGPRAAYEAVLAEYPVTAAQLTDTTLDVRVAVDETPEVEALARRAAPAVSTTVQFGNVTRTGQGDYAAADALLAELTAAGPVVGAVLSPDSAQVTVADLVTLRAMYTAVGDGPQYDGVALTIRTADDRFAVSSSGGQPAAHLPVLDALSAPAWATLLTAATVDANGLDVRTSDLTLEQAHELGAALAGTPVGVEIEVRPGTGIGFRLVTSAGLAVEDLDTFGEPTGTEGELLVAFVDGWNATA
ncbi:hypothetical protein [Cellulomonas sp.]|uniref:hypothetical protein n=1 Tax=Cellulomonas sp. TaxID=40001 RepID=UPI003BAC9A2D